MCCYGLWCSIVCFYIVFDCVCVIVFCIVFLSSENRKMYKLTFVWRTLAYQQQPFQIKSSPSIEPQPTVLVTLKRGHARNEDLK